MKKQATTVKSISVTRLFLGCLIAFWLGKTVNPGFYAISALIFAWIPFLTIDQFFVYETIELPKKQPEPIVTQPVEAIEKSLEDPEELVFSDMNTFDTFEDFENHSKIVEKAEKLSISELVDDTILDLVPEKPTHSILNKT